MNKERWFHLPITLAGQVNTVKMNILLKFLFLFRTVPILIWKSFFTSIDKTISNFLWNKKSPRIRKAYLQHPKWGGGMGLPHFQSYYWSCHIHALSFWVQCDKHTEVPIWVQMEWNSCYFSSLSTLLSSPMPLSLQYVKNNPVVTHSLKIWSTIRTNYGWQNRSLFTRLPQSPFSSINYR